MCVIKSHLTLPNVLSISRIIFLPVLVYLVLIEARLVFLWVYLLVGATDAFDGIIARKFNQVSEFGKTIDSTADLLFYLATAWFIYRLYPEPILANQTLLFSFFGLLGFSFVLSAILLKAPVMMHTTLLRYGAVLVYFLVIFSYSLDTTLFLRFILIFYLIGFSEEILIFIFYPGFDRDAKSIWHLHQEKKSKLRT
jgi:cardiolipin synthase